MADEISVDVEKGAKNEVTPAVEPTKKRKAKWSFKSPDERAKELQQKLQKDPYQSQIPDVSTIWRQVNEKNKTGAYNFERFESMQLLNLCLLQHEIRTLSEEVYHTIRKHAHDEETWDCDYPEEVLKEPVERLRPLLKEYSMFSIRLLRRYLLTRYTDETLISVNSVMSFPRAALDSIGQFDKTKVAGIPRLMVSKQRYVSGNMALATD